MTNASHSHVKTTEPVSMGSMNSPAPARVAFLDKLAQVRGIWALPSSICAQNLSKIMSFLITHAHRQCLKMVHKVITADSHSPFFSLQPRGHMPGWCEWLHLRVQTGVYWTLLLGSAPFLSSSLVPS